MVMTFFAGLSVEQNLNSSRASIGRKVEATTLLSGLLLCEDCGSRFIASDQYSYQCATRTYGGLSACSNKVRVKRARAEAAIVEYIAEELLSPEAVDVAKRAYQEAIREGLGTCENAKVIG